MARTEDLRSLRVGGRSPTGSPNVRGSTSRSSQVLDPPDQGGGKSGSASQPAADALVEGQTYEFPELPGRWRFKGGSADNPGSWEAVTDPPSSPKTTRSDFIDRLAGQKARFREGVGRGMQDIFEGVQQAIMQVRGPSLEEVQERGGVTTPAREFTEMVNRERGGVDADPVARFAGQSLPLLPLALIPGGASASLLTRLASGAAAGGAAGGVMFSPSGTGRERAFNAAIGAGAGMVIPEAIRAGLGRVGASALNRAGPTDEALARQADFERLGIRPTTGQVTRNPRALATERNVAQIAGVGDDVAAVRAGQSSRLAQLLDDAVPGEDITTTEAGRRIMGTLGTRFDDEGIYRQMGRKIDDMYDAARAARGADEALDFGEFRARDAVRRTVDDYEDKIPDAVKRRLSEFADEREFTVGEAVKLRQLLRDRASATNDPETALGLSELKRQVDAFLDAAAEEGAGGDAIELFRLARDASNRRARAFDTRGMQKVVSDQADPDSFVKKYVIGAPVDDVRQMRVTLLRKGGDEGRRAWDTARRQVVEYLQDKAVNDAGNFSASRYNNALSKIGKDKLETLFESEEREMLERIGRAATNLFTDPPSGGIPVGNRSGTAAGNVSNIPGLQFIERISRSRAAGRALAGSPVDRIGNAQRASAVASRLINPRGTNPFAAPGGLLGDLVTRRLLGENR